MARDRDIDMEKKAHMKRLLDEQVAQKQALVAAEKEEDIAVRACLCEHALVYAGQRPDRCEHFSIDPVYYTTRISNHQIHKQHRSSPAWRDCM